MRCSSTRVLWLLALGLSLLGGIAWAYSTGPTEPATGAPGQVTCADVACHTGFPVNSGSGVFTISAVTSTPGQYTPDDTLDFDVHLQQSGQKRWGFQLTVISSAGDPAGSILVSEPARTHAETGAGGRQYLAHTAAGSDSGTADASPGWHFKWKAPGPGAGPVTFYAAGNAADADGTSLGDYVYTTSAVFTEGSASVNEPDDTRPGSFSLGLNVPNPFNAGTRLQYILDARAAGPVSLAVYDIAGRRIRLLASPRYVGPGEHWVDWDGRNEEGADAPSGTFVVTLTTRAGSDSRKVTLLR